MYSEHTYNESTIDRILIYVAEPSLLSSNLSAIQQYPNSSNKDVLVGGLIPMFYGQQVYVSDPKIYFLYKSNPWDRPWVGFERMISELQGRCPNHLA